MLMSDSDKEQLRVLAKHIVKYLRCPCGFKPKKAQKEPCACGWVPIEDWFYYNHGIDIRELDN